MASSSASAPATATAAATATASSAPSTASTADDDDQDNNQWPRFEARVKGLIPAVVGLASMFTARHLPCPLRTLAGTLAAVGFDVVTLRYVCVCI